MTLRERARIAARRAKYHATRARRAKYHATRARPYGSRPGMIRDALAALAILAALYSAVPYLPALAATLKGFTI